MNQYFLDWDRLLIGSVLGMVIVLMAMAVDLAAGLWKAKVRGEVHTSKGYRRTVTKFVVYEGALLIATGIDSIMHFCRFWDLISLPFHAIPIITFIVAAFLCFVEGKSVCEKAENKEELESTAESGAKMATELLANGDKLQQLIDLLGAMGKKEDERHEERKKYYNSRKAEMSSATTNN